MADADDQKRLVNLRFFILNNSKIAGNTWWGFRASTALFLKIFGKEVPSFDIIPKSSSVNSTVTTSVISYNTYTDFYIDAGINGIAKIQKLYASQREGIYLYGSGGYMVPLLHRLLEINIYRLCTFF